MEEYGTHNQPKGTWSDNSSMMIATIDGLINSSLSDIDYVGIMKNFLKWKRDYVLEITDKFILRMLKQ